MAESDVSTLVARLTLYSQALERHNLDVQHAYDTVLGSLRSLRSEYGGEAADEFFEHWDRTCDDLEKYLQGAGRMKAALDAHVAQLRHADTRGDTA